MQGVVPQTWIWARVPTGFELELGVEGRHFEDADIGHAEHVGDRSRSRRAVTQPSCSCARISSGMIAPIAGGLRDTS